MRGISICTKFWHTPVDELHSIENARVINPRFSLTSSATGVKTHSFFDKFKALQSVVCRFGVRASALRSPGNIVTEARFAALFTFG
jgi:hypothetical protein